MLKVPVVWVRCPGIGNPEYYKVAGDPFFLVGEEGENILAVSKSARTFIPIFEAHSVVVEGGEHLSVQAIRSYVLDRMIALAECCMLETGQVGTIYGFFRNYSVIGGDALTHLLEAGLACTASEFNPEGEKLGVEYCERFGLPVEIEIDTVRGQPSGSDHPSS